MKECIYKDLKFKILIGYDGFQVYEKVSNKYDIWGYVDTFKDCSSAMLFINNMKQKCDSVEKNKISTLSKKNTIITLNLY